MPTLTIYTRRFCPFCVRAMKTLKAAGIEEFEEIPIDGREGTLRREIMARTGGRWDVPQAFIDGEHIGDDDDLAGMAKSGELQRRLA